METTGTVANSMNGGGRWNVRDKGDSPPPMPSRARDRSPRRKNTSGKDESPPQLQVVCEELLSSWFRHFSLFAPHPYHSGVSQLMERSETLSNTTRCTLRRVGVGVDNTGTHRFPDFYNKLRCVGVSAEDALNSYSRFMLQNAAVHASSIFCGRLAPELRETYGIEHAALEDGRLVVLERFALHIVFFKLPATSAHPSTHTTFYTHPRGLIDFIERAEPPESPPGEPLVHSDGQLRCSSVVYMEYSGEPATVVALGAGKYTGDLKPRIFANCAEYFESLPGAVVESWRIEGHEVDAFNKKIEAVAIEQQIEEALPQEVAGEASLNIATKRESYCQCCLTSYREDGAEREQWKACVFCEEASYCSHLCRDTERSRHLATCPGLD